MTEPEPLPVDAFLEELTTIRATAGRAILAEKYGRPPLANAADTEAARRPEIIFLLQLGVYPE